VTGKVEVEADQARNVGIVFDHKDEGFSRRGVCRGPRGTGCDGAVPGKRHENRSLSGADSERQVLQQCCRMIKG
jgi:hypothetical protein